MEKVVIVSAARTPIGSFNGQFKDLTAVELGCVAVKAAIERDKVPVDQIDEVIMGHVLTAGCGENTTRQVALHSGIPQEVPAFTINKLCGSGLRAVSLAAQQIELGDADIVVTGGMESMSNAPYVIAKARRGYRMGNGVLEDTMLRDGLVCTENGYHMGVTAENIASRFGVSREDQDLCAYNSQMRAAKAQKEGKFDAQIVPVTIHNRKKGDIVISTDEHIRPDTTLEGLAKLKPAFTKDGTVTAGNASGLNDAACALVLMSESKAKELGIKPIAKILNWASAGVEPAIMGTGPIPACHKLFDKTGLKMEDFQLVELNEAFAAQAVYCCRELHADMEKTNIYGSGISLGHPVGCSGARILTTLLYALAEPERKNGSRLGLAALCIGGGQGTAVAIKMCD